MYIGLLSLGYSGQSVNLFTPLDLASSSGMSGNALLHLCAHGVDRGKFLFFLPLFILK